MLRRPPSNKEIEFEVDTLREPFYNGKGIICFDFDGVIHSYTSGWQGADVINDPLVDGIKEAIQEIRKDYRVAVHSARCSQAGGMEAIREYLAKHDIEVDGVVNFKPPAILTVDDRVICFDGNPNDLLIKIKGFKVWNKDKASQV